MNFFTFVVLRPASCVLRHESDRGGVCDNAVLRPASCVLRRELCYGGA